MLVSLNVNHFSFTLFKIFTNLSANVCCLTNDVKTKQKHLFIRLYCMLCFLGSSLCKKCKNDAFKCKVQKSCVIYIKSLYTTYLFGCRIKHLKKCYFLLSRYNKPHEITFYSSLTKTDWNTLTLEWRFIILGAIPLLSKGFNLVQLQVPVYYAKTECVGNERLIIPFERL